MASILLVEDNIELSHAMSQLLSTQNHEITEAENGQVAQEILQRKNFDLIISDYQLPVMDGLELLKWVKSTLPIKFILMTGFAHVIEKKVAYSYGVDEFLTKPLHANVLFEAVNRLLVEASQAKTSLKNIDHHYCSIPVEEFVSNNEVKIPLYIRLSEVKYVRIAYQGDQVQGDRVDNYKERGIQFLYCRWADLAQMLDFNLDLATRNQADSPIAREVKAEFINSTIATMMGAVAVKGLNENKLAQATEAMERSLKMINESDRIFHLLNLLNSHTDWLYAHSLAVGLFSVMIARQMGWTAPATLFKISLAGLFHDIGQKEIEPQILNKKYGHLSPKDLKAYESHPHRGSEIMHQLHELPAELAHIISSHHHDDLGGGHPAQMGSERIHPIAKVVSVADHFCYHAVRNSLSPGCSASEALMHMKKMNIDTLYPVPFRALCELQDPMVTASAH